MLVPAQADKTYRGRVAALWILGLVLFLKTGIAAGSMFNAREAATTADGIPIDSYGPAGAQTVLALFGLVGLANLLICAVGVVVLWRYRSLVPLTYVMLLVYQLGRSLVLVMRPIERTGTPAGSWINRGLLLALVVGLALSLWPRAADPPRSG